MIAGVIFVLVFLFFVSVWVGVGALHDKYDAWAKEQYARKHFRQTERFRREFE